MSQVFVPPSAIVDGQFILRGPDAHHVLRVLRKKEGDLMVIFDGRGRRYEGRLMAVETDKSSARGAIIQELSSPVTKPALHLFQGLPRGAKFDFVIEKSVELGVDVLVPFLSEKNPIRLDDSQRAHKKQRWTSVAKAASQQCDRTTLPIVEDARPLKDFESWIADGMTLVLDTSEQKGQLRDSLRGVTSETPLINIVVGPESGFSPDEVEWLRNLGGRMISLGERILRTETAGLAVLSIINYELGLI